MQSEKKEPNGNSSSMCKADQTMTHGAKLPDFAYDGIPVSPLINQNELQTNTFFRGSIPESSLFIILTVCISFLIVSLI